MEKIEKILTICIAEIRSGRSTLEDCLNRYPSMRGELNSLLRIALSIQAPPQVKPDPDFKTRARAQLMEYIREQKAPKKSGI